MLLLERIHVLTVARGLSLIDCALDLLLQLVTDLVTVLGQRLLRREHGRVDIVPRFHQSLALLVGRRVGLGVTHLRETRVVA